MYFFYKASFFYTKNNKFKAFNVCLIDSTKIKTFVIWKKEIQKIYKENGWSVNWTQDPCNSSQRLYHWAFQADIHSS